MAVFPGEQGRSAEIQKNLGQQFSYAETCLDSWLRINKGPGLQNLTRPIGLVGMMLDVQAIRLFRSVIELCKRCEAYTANIVSRTLFETFLAQRFLLEPIVRIVVESSVKAGTTTFRATVGEPRPNESLSRELRAWLFLAHNHLDLERDVDKAGAIPELEGEVEKLKKAYSDPLAADCLKQVGPAWMQILTKSKSYSGLKIKELCEAINQSMLRWYKTIYGFQSGPVHGTGSLQHVQQTGPLSIRREFLFP